METKPAGYWFIVACTGKPRYATVLVTLNDYVVLDVGGVPDVWSLKNLYPTKAKAELAEENRYLAILLDDERGYRRETAENQKLIRQRKKRLASLQARVDKESRVTPRARKGKS